MYDPIERNAFAGAAAAVGLDLDGMICALDPIAAELLGASRDELLGKPIAGLIPGLPLRRNTPGYNVAYVVLWYANGARRRVQGLKLGGGVIFLEISVAMMSPGSPFSFLMGLRRASVSPELRDSPSSDCEAPLPMAA